MTIYFDITGHELSVGKPLSDVLENGATNILTAAGALDTALGTAVKGTGWTSGMTLKAHDNALTTIKGSGWTNQTIKGNADKIASTDLYPITVVGGNTTSAAVFTAIGNKPTNRTPAVGDEIVMIVGVVTASGVPVASPAIVAADNLDGVVKLLALDTTVKVKWGKSSGADLSANTYTCWVKPA